MLQLISGCSWNGKDLSRMLRNLLYFIFYFLCVKVIKVCYKTFYLLLFLYIKVITICYKTFSSFLFKRNVTKPFIAILPRFLVVNLLLWIDFNISIVRRKKQKESTACRLRFEWIGLWSDNDADFQAIGGIGGFPRNHCGAARRRCRHPCSLDANSLEPPEDQVFVDHIRKY